jgi:hypothetical protein
VDLAATEVALDALEADGGRLFDAPSCDCIRTLITRAEELAGPVGALLAVRAHAHVERLRSRFYAARTETERRIAEAEQRHGPLPVVRELLARGELASARRKLRRLATEPPPARDKKEQAARERDKQRGSNDYEESLAELVASFALARAIDVVPEHAGPYNPLRIASDLLARMRTVSPLYLTAQLNRLEELASMLELPELPEPASKTLPRKKRRVLRSGS